MERSCYNCVYCQYELKYNEALGWYPDFYRECSLTDEDGWSDMCKTNELENFIPRKTDI